ncbi:MAG: ribosomal-processing cysteine protease Prp [Candidatus Coprovivens sp.]
MIKVIVKKRDNKISQIVVKGHANYDTFGKDIVCASVSTMMITTINCINVLDESLDFEEKKGLLVIRVIKDTEVNQKLLDNLIIQLEELVSLYPKNIEIRNED